MAFTRITLSDTETLQINGQKTDGISVINDNVTFPVNYRPVFGVAEGNINQFYHATLTLAHATPAITLDLFDLVNAVGDDVVLGAVNMVVIMNNSEVATLTVGNAATAQAQLWFGGVTDTETIMPLDFAKHNSIAGWINADPYATNWNLKIASDDTTNDTEIEVIIVGFDSGV